MPRRHPIHHFRYRYPHALRRPPVDVLGLGRQTSPLDGATKGISASLGGRHRAALSSAKTK